MVPMAVTLRREKWCEVATAATGPFIETNRTRNQGIQEAWASRSSRWRRKPLGSAGTARSQKRFRSRDRRPDCVQMIAKAIEADARRRPTLDRP